MFFRRQNLIRKVLLTDLPVAAAFFLLCLSLDISNAEAQTKIALTQKQSNEKLLAQAASALAAEDLPLVADILRRFVLNEPRNLKAQALAGITADKQNDLMAAEKHFAAAAKIAPSARNNYGAILLRLNKKTEAAREFEASLKANPNKQSALINLAQIRFSENNFTAARELFELAKTIQPDAEILKALVIISLQLNETTRAAAEEFKVYFVAPAPTKDATLGELLLSKNLLAEVVAKFLKFEI